MEPAVITRAPLALSAAMPLLVIRPSRGFASTSFPSIFGGGGGGGDSGADTAAAAATAATLCEAETADADVVLLHVEGMSCGGCAASVKRILESQPKVTSAMVDIEKVTAFVWTTPEAKATKGWQKQLGEKLANHLTTCGFLSHLHDEDETVRPGFFNLESPVRPPHYSLDQQIMRTGGEDRTRAAEASTHSGSQSVTQVLPDLGGGRLLICQGCRRPK